MRLIGLGLSLLLLAGCQLPDGPAVVMPTVTAPPAAMESLAPSPSATPIASPSPAVPSPSPSVYVPSPSPTPDLEAERQLEARSKAAGEEALAQCTQDNEAQYYRTMDHYVGNIGDGLRAQGMAEEDVRAAIREAFSKINLRLQESFTQLVFTTQSDCTQAQANAELAVMEGQ